MLKVDILRYCSQHGITNVQLADMVGVMPQNVKATVGKNPKSEVVCRCADALGVSPLSFFYEKNEENESIGMCLAEQMAEQTAVAVEKPQEAVAEHIGGNVFMCPHCQEKFALGVSLVPLK